MQVTTNILEGTGLFTPQEISVVITTPQSVKSIKNYQTKSAIIKVESNFQ